VVSAAVLLAVVTWQVAGHGPVWRWDVRADSAVLRLAAHHPGVGPWAEVAADLGDVGVALPSLALVLGYVVWRTRRWVRVVGCAGVMAAAGAVVVPVKAAVGRPAPGGVVPAGHAGYPGYFPSGHAATAAMAYAVAVLAVWPVVERAAARRLLVLAAVPLNLVVGAGLVWRGYHWPLDVVASWCLCWVLLGCAVAGAVALRSWWGSPG
jgi:undecaprenyl-diphosphatase